MSIILDFVHGLESFSNMFRKQDLFPLQEVVFL
jgi:hypothetical protein